MAIDAKPACGSWPEGTGMIYMAMSPWQGMWKNRHQLMSRFAAEMPVLYVEPWMRLRYLRRHWVELLGRQRESSSGELLEGARNLHVYRSPPSRPVSGSKLIGRWTAHRWLAGVRKAAQKAGIRRPILWMSLPEMAFAAGKMNELMSIYHVVDEYGGYARQTADRQERLWSREELMLEAVDMTIVVSPELARAKQKPGRNVHIVENAVDFDVFARAASGNRTPADLLAVRQPRLGYSGLVGQRLDLDLLIHLAQARPDWSLVFVGKVDETGCAERLQALRALDNVHFLGQKPVTEVPDYIAGLDAGLLPYAINLETENISPLKMYEYFAAGIPVVSTPIPAAKRNSDYLQVASTDDEFVRLCQQSLISDDAGARQRRVEHAKANTWDIRVAETRQLLRKHLRNSGAMK